MRPFLTHRLPRSSPLALPAQAAVRFARFRDLPALGELRSQILQLEGLCEQRRQLAEQERLHFWLHAWLLVHVPLSAGLPVLIAAHVISSFYY
jgi:hypothetical protein